MKKFLWVFVAFVFFVGTAFLEVEYTRSAVSEGGVVTEKDPVTKTLMLERGSDNILDWAMVSATIVAFTVLGAMLVSQKFKWLLVEKMALCYFALGSVMHIACIFQPLPAQVILAIPGIIRGTLAGYFFL